MRRFPHIAFDPVRGYYLTRWPALPPSVRAALRVFQVQDGPGWERLLRWWLATPQGLFANFASGFIGLAYLGPAFLPVWWVGLLFLPAAVLYRRTR